MFLTKRSLRIPLAVLAVSALVGVVFLTVNISAVGHDPTRWASVRSDLRTAVSVAILLAALWIAVDVLKSYVEESIHRVTRAYATMQIDLDGIRRRLDEMDAPTLAIPRRHLTETIVGTATVRSDLVGALPTETTTAIAADPAPELTTFLAETAEIYELGRQAGRAERDDPPIMEK